MNCENISKMMTDLLAGELSEQDKALLDAHLASCENCRKEFDQFKAVWSLTESALKADNLCSELHPSHHEKILEHARTPAPQPSKSRIIQFKWLEIAASIAICAIIAAILLPAYFTANRKMACKSPAAYEAMDRLRDSLPDEKSYPLVATPSSHQLPSASGTTPAAGPADAKRGHETKSFEMVATKSDSLPRMEEESKAPAKKAYAYSRAKGAPSAPAAAPEKPAEKAPEAIVFHDLGYDSDAIEKKEESPALPVAGKMAAKSSSGRKVAKNSYGGAAAAKQEVAVNAAPATPAPAAAAEPAMEVQQQEIADEDTATTMQLFSKGGKVVREDMQRQSVKSQPQNSLSKEKRDLAKDESGQKILAEHNKFDSDKNRPVLADRTLEMKKLEKKREILDSMETRLYTIKKDALREIGGNNEELVKYFKGKGVFFDETCKLNYDPENGKLTISNIPDEQRKVEAIIEGLKESYEKSKEFKNGIPFNNTKQKPFSTFSIDVDTASYTMARKLLKNGVKPDPMSVRPEEFINFFDYHYRSPSNSTFAVYLETAPSVFRLENYTLRVGVKAREIGPDGSRASVFTILIDASGSMSQANRMELVKKSLPSLFDQLKPNDKIAVLACTHRVINLGGYLPASEKKTLSKLVEGIMPAGVADIENGLVTAYDLALKHYQPGAYNRVILITDGISNIGTPSAEKILAKVSASRNMGVTNTVVAVGGDGDDKFLEKIANKGDGNYVFVDSEDSAKEVFVKDFEGRFREIARDVKIQVEFNPLVVDQYRQVGYQNRQLSKADFRNDKVDAGEVGAGQSVTALYELKLNPRMPAGPQQTSIDNPMSNSICVVRLRYRRADNMDVEEKEFALACNEIKADPAKASSGFKLASSVAEFAEFLRFPDVPGIANPGNIMGQIQGVLGEDYRNDGKVSELYNLIKNVK